MERIWRQRARQFDPSFSEDRADFLDAGLSSFNWKETIFRFCQNVREIESPPDIWAGADGPSQAASRSVTAAFSQMLADLGEINRLHFSGAA
jgi:hypothetical protein